MTVHYGLWLISTNGDGDRDGSLYGEFPDSYIVLCRTFSTGMETEMEMETFPGCYCTHFRDKSPSQFYYILIRGLESVSVPVEKPA